MIAKASEQTLDVVIRLWPSSDTSALYTPLLLFLLSTVTGRVLTCNKSQALHLKLFTFQLCLYPLIQPLAMQCNTIRPQKRYGIDCLVRLFMDISLSLYLPLMLSLASERLVLNHISYRLKRCFSFQFKHLIRSVTILHLPKSSAAWKRHLHTILLL